jgi:hypothetical protein
LVDKCTIYDYFIDNENTGDLILDSRDLERKKEVLLLLLKRFCSGTEEQKSTW